MAEGGTYTLMLARDRSGLTAVTITGRITAIAIVRIATV